MKPEIVVAGKGQVHGAVDAVDDGGVATLGVRACTGRDAVVRVRRGAPKIRLMAFMVAEMLQIRLSLVGIVEDAAGGEGDPGGGRGPVVDGNGSHDKVADFVGSSRMIPFLFNWRKIPESMSIFCGLEIPLTFYTVPKNKYKARDAEWATGLERAPPACVQLKVSSEAPSLSQWLTPRP